MHAIDGKVQMGMFGIGMQHGDTLMLSKAQCLATGVFNAGKACRAQIIFRVEGQHQMVGFVVPRTRHFLGGSHHLDHRRHVIEAAIADGGRQRLAEMGAGDVVHQTLETGLLPPGLLGDLLGDHLLPQLADQGMNGGFEVVQFMQQFAHIEMLMPIGIFIA